MKLPELQTKEPHAGYPYWEVDGKSAVTPADAAQHGYRKGAEVVANMVKELVYANDMKGLLDLIKATDTKSFYGEPR